MFMPINLTNFLKLKLKIHAKNRSDALRSQNKRGSFEYFEFIITLIAVSRPLKNAQFRSSPRKAKISTAGIH
jgi:hypothetical protein